MVQVCRKTAANDMPTTSFTLWKAARKPGQDHLEPRGPSKKSWKCSLSRNFVKLLCCLCVVCIGNQNGSLCQADFRCRCRCEHISGTRHDKPTCLLHHFPPSDPKSSRFYCRQGEGPWHCRRQIVKVSNSCEKARSTLLYVQALHAPPHL